MRKLRKHAGGLGRFFGLPLPCWALELGARLIRTETELILKSRKVVPEKLIQDGYRFALAEIEDVLLKRSAKTVVQSPPRKRFTHSPRVDIIR